VTFDDISNWMMIVLLPGLNIIQKLEKFKKELAQPEDLEVTISVPSFDLEHSLESSSLV
jgi:hypothetical protein